MIHIEMIFCCWMFFYITQSVPVCFELNETGICPSPGATFTIWLTGMLRPSFSCKPVGKSEGRLSCLFAEKSKS